MLAHTDPKQWISYIIMAVIVSFVLARRVQRMSQFRPLKIERLWMLPSVYLIFAGTIFYFGRPDPLGWALSGAALLVGGALGWQRGRLMRIEVDPVTQSLSQRASPAAMLFLLLLVAVRFGARSVVTAGGPLHISALVLTDTLVAFALGLLTMQRIEMFLRARRLLTSTKMAAA
ncbi:MAG: hypothetical protein ACKVOB_04410 [Sphingomonas sp.]